MLCRLNKAFRSCAHSVPKTKKAGAGASSIGAQLLVGMTGFAAATARAVANRSCHPVQDANDVSGLVGMTGFEPATP
jgi:hypothetical protein